MASLGAKQQIVLNSEAGEGGSRTRSREGSVERKVVSMEREEKIKIARERQNEERLRKIEELKVQAEAAQRYREQKDEERRRRIEEIRNRDTEKRNQVEERKRAIMEADRERREFILKKDHDRESRLETKKRDRNSICFAFGSSTPRLLEPADFGTVSPSTFWGQRRSTSISNVPGATLSRRSSERELNISGSKKRATSAGGTDYYDDDKTDSPAAQIMFRSVARRKTDLMPTIPSPREGHYGSKSSLTFSSRTPGRAYSMNRLDQLAQPIRRNGEHICAILEREQRIRREQSEDAESVSSVKGYRRRVSSKHRNADNVSGTMSRSLNHLAGGSPLQLATQRTNSINSRSSGSSLYNSPSGYNGKRGTFKSMSILTSNNNNSWFDAVPSHNARSNLGLQTSATKKFLKESLAFPSSGSPRNKRGQFYSSTNNYQFDPNSLLLMNSASILINAGSRSGNVTPGGSMNNSRPGSSMSTSTVATSGNVTRRSVQSARKPRPASIAGTGLSLTDTKPPVKSLNSSFNGCLTPKRTASNVMSMSMTTPSSTTRLYSSEKKVIPSRELNSSKHSSRKPATKTKSIEALNQQSDNNSLHVKDNSVNSMSKSEVFGLSKMTSTTTATKTTPSKASTTPTAKTATTKSTPQKTTTITATTTATSNTNDTPSLTQPIAVSSSVLNDNNNVETDVGKDTDLLNLQNEPLDNNTADLAKEEKEAEINSATVVEKSSSNGEENLLIDITDESENLIMNTTTNNIVEMSTNVSTNTLAPGTGPVMSDMMSASMIARNKITTEEEAKAALAERRRKAREEADRQAELERQRLEAERLAHLKQLEEEAEQQRQFEAEALSMAEEQRKAEEERLRQAIEDAKERELEEQSKREEEERLRLEREQTEKKLKEEAEKAKVEVAERLKREEKEREERRKRVEAIMSRTRKGGANASNPNATPTKDNNDGQQQADPPNSASYQESPEKIANSENNSWIEIKSVEGSTINNEPNNTTTQSLNNIVMYEQSVVDKENALINSFSNMVIGENVKNLQQSQQQPQQPLQHIGDVILGKQSEPATVPPSTLSATVANGNGHIENVCKNEINILHNTTDFNIDSQDINTLNFDNNNSLLLPIQPLAATAPLLVSADKNQESKDDALS